MNTLGFEKKGLLKINPYKEIWQFMGMVEIMTFAMGLIMIGCFATSLNSSDDCRLVCSLISDLLDTFWMESKRIWSLVIAGG